MKVFLRIIAFAVLFGPRLWAGASPGALKSVIFTDLDIKVPHVVSKVSWWIDREGETEKAFVVAIRFLPEVGEIPPRTQVWLLKEDGSVLAQTAEPQTGMAALMMGRMHRFISGKSYFFAPSAPKEILGIVVSINGKLFSRSVVTPKP